jgi:hypothetical protein
MPITTYTNTWTTDTIPAALTRTVTPVVYVAPTAQTVPTTQVR